MFGRWFDSDLYQGKVVFVDSKLNCNKVSSNSGMLQALQLIVLAVFGAVD